MSDEEKPEGESSNDVIDRLVEEPYAFRFFQAVRLLHRHRPGRSPVGRFEDPANEVVRFGANPDLSFPPGEIQDLESNKDEPSKMTVNFLGLVGHLGVLPQHYSVLVSRLTRARDRALLDFLDLFHHRVTSLFYRAMERSRFYAQYERGEEDALTSQLFNILGLAEEPARAALQIEPGTLLEHAGLFAPRNRSAIALEQLIEDRFRVPVDVEQFVGAWYDVSDTAQCRVDDAAHEHAQRLGVGALVGDAVWDPQARARIVLGPLSRERFDDFLPSGAGYAQLRELTRFFADDEVEFELRLILDPEDVPPLRLGMDGEPPLGWGSWIRSGEQAPATAETVLPL